jgi:hypothetical protein
MTKGISPRTQFERILGWCYPRPDFGRSHPWPLGKPGYVIEKQPADVRARLEQLTSDDLKDVAPWWVHIIR